MNYIRVFFFVKQELGGRLQMWIELPVRPMQLQMKGVGVFDMKRHKLE